MALQRPRSSPAQPSCGYCLAARAARSRINRWTSCSRRMECGVCCTGRDLAKRFLGGVGTGIGSSGGTSVLASLATSGIRALIRSPRRVDSGKTPDSACRHTLGSHRGWVEAGMPVDGTNCLNLEHRLAMDLPSSRLVGAGDGWGRRSWSQANTVAASSCDDPTVSTCRELE
jgi:hypothetical protein